MLKEASARFGRSTVGEVNCEQQTFLMFIR